MKLDSFVMKAPVALYSMARHVRANLKRERNRCLLKISCWLTWVKKTSVLAFPVLPSSGSTISLGVHALAKLRNSHLSLSPSSAFRYSFLPFRVLPVTFSWNTRNLLLYLHFTLRSTNLWTVTRFFVGFLQFCFFTSQEYILNKTIRNSSEQFKEKGFSLSMSFLIMEKILRSLTTVVLCWQTYLREVLNLLRLCTTAKL